MPAEGRSRAALNSLLYICKGSASGCQRMEEEVKKKSDTGLVHSHKEGGKCCLTLMDDTTGALQWGR